MCVCVCGGQWSRPRWRREVRQQQGNWVEKKSIVGLATNSFTFVLSSSFDFDVRGSVPCSVAICLIFCLDVERPGGPRGCLGRCSAMICLAVYLNLEQPDTLTRRRGLREANAAGSRVRGSMRVFCL